jgi:flagellar hook-basal body complex protein FliE
MTIPPLSTSPLTPVASPQTSRPIDGLKQTGETFQSYLDTLSETQNNSDALLKKLAAGEDVDLHNVMLATEQTDISFRVAMAIRDRLVDAYRETMRMSV